jgi:hypothetical protein
MTNTIQNKIEEAIRKIKHKSEVINLSLWYVNPDHIVEELSSIATLAQEEERKEMIEKLTVKLDTKEMLNGWERYWAKVSDDRYVEDCMECENAKRILSTISNTTLQ